MPQLFDLLEKRKFQKKTYRAWALSGIAALDVQDTDNHSGNKKANIKLTTKEHQANNEVTYLKHPDNERLPTKEQLGNDTANLTDNKERLADCIESIKRLCGIQKDIFLFVIDICSARGTLDTGIMLSSDLAKAANCSIGSAKTSLNRLVEKQLIIRHRGKASRGGFLVLGVSNEIQLAALQAQRLLANSFKSDNNRGNSVLPNSSNNNKKTNTTMPSEWEKIDTRPLEHLGFSETQIRQLFEFNSTTPDIVQDSINRFAYSLEHVDNVKKYKDPLNVLMGILRKGQRWNEPNYLSPKEISLRQMLEESRAKREQEQTMIKELIELEFPEWRRKLTNDELNQIVPEETRQSNFSGAVLSALRRYFTEHIIMPRIDNLEG